MGIPRLLTCDRTRKTIFGKDTRLALPGLRRRLAETMLTNWDTKLMRLRCLDSSELHETRRGTSIAILCIAGRIVLERTRRKLAARRLAHWRCRRKRRNLTVLGRNILERHAEVVVEDASKLQTEHLGNTSTTYAMRHASTPEATIKACDTN